MKPHVITRSVTRIASRLAVATGGLLLLLGACIIEERPYDKHLGDCTRYCQQIDALCPQVYDRPGACMAVCQLMDQGDEFGGLVGNTVACRLERLLQQDFEPATECATVGPGGNDVCGSNCEALCSLRAQVCGPISGQSTLPDIVSNGTCMRNCETLADDKTFDAARDRKGDTVQCRLIHVAESAISRALAAEHCEHSQTVPPPGETVPCSDTQILSKDAECEKYCGIAMGACENEYKVFDSPEQCMASCRLLEPGMLGDQNGDSIRCRRYHSYAALGDAKEHCTHTGPTGDGHCGGGNCVSYCRIARQACPAEFAATYGPDTDLVSASSCESACGMLDGAATNGFRDNDTQRYNVLTPPQGDTLMCRTYHAVQALGARNDPRQCAAALGAPGSECQ